MQVEISFLVVRTQALANGVKMNSKLIAAVAGGLVLGAAVFIPFGANAITQEIKQVSAAQEKVAAQSEATSDELTAGAENTVQSAGIDPVATPDPIAVTGPTFSSDDDDDSADVNDDESGDVNDDNSGDVNDDESDD